MCIYKRITLSMKRKIWWYVFRLWATVRKTKCRFNSFAERKAVSPEPRFCKGPLYKFLSQVHDLIPAWLKTL